MPKKLTRSKLIKKLDAIFSKYIRLKNSDKNGYCVCITCNKKLHWKEIQAGHFISRKHYSTRWDEDNVHPQCVACNVYRAGEQYKYSVALGPYLSDKIYMKSQKIVKYKDYELEEKINNYSTFVKNTE
jgi:hypothetical protein